MPERPCAAGDSAYGLRAASRVKIRLAAFVLSATLPALFAACSGSAQVDSPTASTVVAAVTVEAPTTLPTLAPSSPTAAIAIGVITTSTPAESPEPIATPSLESEEAKEDELDITVSATATASVPATASNTPTLTMTPSPPSTPTADLPAETPATEATETVQAPPPSSNVVEQPPYAASACSDRYPCNDDVAGWEWRIRVPQGYVDKYYGRVEGNPTSIAFGPDGRLYIALLQGSIVAMDASGLVSGFAGGLNTPTGIAFRPGSGELYVSSRVRNDSYGGEAQISIVEGGGARQLVGGLPCCYAGMHGPNGIAFGPDGFGYVGVGGRADHGEVPDGSNQRDEPHPLEASILRFSPDGSTVESFAKGFRNPYDIAWNAAGQLFASDNSPDYGPPEELHRVVPGGQHGYPWFDCSACFAPPGDVQLVAPVAYFVPHASPTGLTAYLGTQFPGAYNHLFVTLWSAFPGAQKVVRLNPGGTGAVDFAMGFAQPIDLTVNSDGSLFVADFATGIIFRISYTG